MCCYRQIAQTYTFARSGRGALIPRDTLQSLISLSFCRDCGAFDSPVNCGLSLEYEAACLSEHPPVRNVCRLLAVLHWTVYPGGVSSIRKTKSLKNAVREVSVLEIYGLRLRAADISRLACTGSARALPTMDVNMRDRYTCRLKGAYSSLAEVDA